jgi:hypothetical protein
MNTDSSLSPTKKDSTLILTSYHEQCQSTNDDLFPVSNNASNMISSLTFSKSVTNSMVDYEYPWMRPGRYS